MTNEIKKIQLKQAQSLLDIYNKRLEEIKLAIIEISKSGGNTLKLALEKKKIENIIKKLKKEFKEFSDEAIEESYRESEKDQKGYLTALGIAAIGLSQTKTIQNVYYTHLTRITSTMDRKLKSFIRTDFSSPKDTLNALNRLIPPQSGVKPLNNIVETGLLSSKVTAREWQALAKNLERNLKNKDIFTIPYYNKNGDIVRHVKASTYAEMLSRTLTANIYREAAKDSILNQFGEFGDLVEILGRSIYPDSPCIPYQGQILSLTGKTKGFTTIDEAKGNGLFHPNCIHSFAVTDNVISVYNKEYPIIEHFSKANILAREAQQAVYQKGIRKGELQERAVAYLYNNIPSARKKGDFIIGRLPKTAKNMLDISIDDARLSLESLAKNVIKHYDMALTDYIKITEILNNPDNIIPQRENHIKFAKNIDNQTYSFILKTTEDKKKNFIISFRKDDH